MQTNETTAEINSFKSKFNLEDLGFENFENYIDSFGFSAKKHFDKGAVDSVSMVSVYIPDKSLTSTNSLRALKINVTYGKLALGGGVQIRSNKKISDPIDLISDDEYFYDLDNKLFFNKKKKIVFAEDIIKEVYSKHIKPSKLITGFPLRFKIFFWNTLMKNLFFYLSLLGGCLLFVISGDEFFYKFDKIAEEVIFANTDKENLLGLSPLKERYKNSPRFKFFGHEAARSSITIFCFLHLIAYLVCSYYDYRPLFITRMVKSSFVSLIYVIPAFFIFESTLPSILKYLIKKSAHLSLSFYWRAVRI